MTAFSKAKKRGMRVSFCKELKLWKGGGTKGKKEKCVDTSLLRTSIGGAVFVVKKINMRNRSATATRDKQKENGKNRKKKRPKSGLYILIRKGNAR